MAVPSVLIVFVCFLALISAAPTAKLAVPIPPSQDPFYQPPEGYENTAPGSILRFRNTPAPLAAFGSVKENIQASYQLLYRTTDAWGNPEATVTTVLVPSNARTDRLVSYQDFMDSANVDCSTSYAIQEGTSMTSMISMGDIVFEAAMLQEGWIVNLPDYEGPKAAFAAGMQTGYATLDSIRAVLQSGNITGLAPNPDITMWGYSGGSIATEFAAELQPTYAPELRILGAAIGGVIANLSSTVTRLNKGVFAGFAAVGVIGLMKEYPNLTNYVNSEIIDSKKDEFFKGNDECAVQVLAQFAFQDMGSYFKAGMDALLAPPVVETITAGGVMGLHGFPTIPLYFYKSIHDEVEGIADTDELVNGYCDKGIGSLEFVRNRLGGHSTGSITGAPGALAFLIDRFKGVPPVEGCHIQTVVLAKPRLGLLSASWNMLKGDIHGLMGLPLGPGHLPFGMGW